MIWRFACEEVARHRYPARGDGGGPGATRRGVEAHARLLGTLVGEGAEVEVPVEWRGRAGEDEVVVSGRIDAVERGLFGDTLVELKTYASPPASLDELEERYPHHVFQLRLYGHLRRAGGAVAGLRLLTLGLASDGSLDARSAREIAVPPRDVEAEVSMTLGSLALMARRTMERFGRRPEIPLPPPFEEWRPHQRGILAFLERCPRAAVVAATGSGKTAPVLCSALGRSLAAGGRLVWATAKTLGQPPVMATARRIRERGSDLRALRLTAQDRLCPWPGPCPHVRGHREAVLRDDVWAVATAAGLVEEAELLAWQERYGVCARALQEELLPLFDLVVGDYNFVLDPAPGARNLVGGGGALVVDEAHNVYERVREGLSAGVALADVHRALEDRAEVRALAAEVMAVLPALPPAGEPAAFEALATPSLRAQALLAATTEIGPGVPFLSSLGQMAWALTDEENPRVGLRDGDGVRLAALDPAPFVAARLAECEPLVLLSATLDPPEVHLGLIGLGDLPSKLVDDPFAAQRKVVLMPAAGSLWEEREREAPKAAAAMARHAAAHPGRYLAFACSYDHAAMVAGALAAAGTSVVLHRRGMDRHEVERTARSFCAEGGTGILVAPAAGILGEGVDLPPGLAGVFLLGPALPAVTEERKAIQAYHDAAGRNGFALAFLVPGMARVVQAAGRVVRREGESAWIVLLDRRLGRQPYRSLLPHRWLGDPE